MLWLDFVQISRKQFRFIITHITNCFHSCALSPTWPNRKLFCGLWGNGCRFSWAHTLFYSDISHSPIFMGNVCLSSFHLSYIEKKMSWHFKRQSWDVVLDIILSNAADYFWRWTEFDSGFFKRNFKSVSMDFIFIQMIYRINHRWSSIYYQILRQSAIDIR